MGRQNRNSQPVANGVYCSILSVRGSAQTSATLAVIKCPPPVRLALLVAAARSALNLITGGPGTSGADFLTVGVGARALAMGGAFTAVDSGADANAVNWNPAALGFIDGSNVTASYNSLFKDENQGYLGYASPSGKTGGVWAGGLNYLTVSKIERRAANTEDPDGTFKQPELRAEPLVCQASTAWP